MCTDNCLMLIHSSTPSRIYVSEGFLLQLQIFFISVGGKIKSLVRLGSSVCYVFQKKRTFEIVLIFTQNINAFYLHYLTF